jgi:glycosyltransferase involved in cell wall biosynthesis
MVRGVAPVDAEAMTIRFSVVVPCYNEESYLAETIRSLQRQDFDGEYEIVVVDNNSTDATAEIARGLGVRVVAEAAPGVCNARQAGTDASRGEIVVSTDADTTHAPDWLTKIDRHFRADADVVAVVGPCRYQDGPRWGRAFGRTLFGAVGLVYRATGRTSYVSATNIAFRRDRWSGYDTRLTQGGDELDVLRRLRREGTVVYDRTNPTFTSGRRFSRGLAYNLFVSLFLFYLAAYFINRVSGRRVLGSAPAYRDSRPALARRIRIAAAVARARLSLRLSDRPGTYAADDAVQYVRSGGGR